MASHLATGNATRVVKEEQMDTCEHPALAAAQPLCNRVPRQHQQSGMVDSQPGPFSLALAPEPPPPSASDPAVQDNSRGRSSSWPMHPNALMEAGGTAASFAMNPQQQLQQPSVVSDTTLALATTHGAGVSSMSPSTPATPVASQQPAGGGKEKKSPRRNAWGPDSYSDLISKAILSTKDKRMTLNQIYEWMVANVPYFRDKGETNSAAGWKNSVRHNLSLHPRFIKVQNEQTGKSNWWMINPDAKRSNRRRAFSMPTDVSASSPIRSRRQQAAAKTKRGAKSGKPLKTEDASSLTSDHSSPAFSPTHLSSPLLDNALSLAAAQSPSLGVCESPLLQDDFDANSPSALFTSPSPNSPGPYLLDANSVVGSFGQPAGQFDIDPLPHAAMYLSGSEGSSYDDSFLSPSDIMPGDSLNEQGMVVGNIPTLALPTDENLGTAISSLSIQPQADAVPSTYRPPFQPTLTPVAGTPFDTPLASIQGTPHHTPPPHARHAHAYLNMSATSTSAPGFLDPYYEQQQQQQQQQQRAQTGSKPAPKSDQKSPLSSQRSSASSIHESRSVTGLGSRQRSISEPTHFGNYFSAPPGFHPGSDEQLHSMCTNMPPPLQPIAPQHQHQHQHQSQQQQQQQQQQHAQQQQAMQQAMQGAAMASMFPTNILAQQQQQQQQQTLYAQMSTASAALSLATGQPPSYTAAHHQIINDNSYLASTQAALLMAAGSQAGQSFPPGMLQQQSATTSGGGGGDGGSETLMPYMTSVVMPNEMSSLYQDAATGQDLLANSGLTEADMDRFMNMAALANTKLDMDLSNQTAAIAAAAAGMPSMDTSPLARQQSDSSLPQLEFNFEHFSPPKEPPAMSTVGNGAQAMPGQHQPMNQRSWLAKRNK